MNGNFSSFWQARLALARAPREITVEREPFSNPMAEYMTLSFPSADGKTLRARYIRPLAAEKAPTLLLFHDYTTPVRGWHHMTRYIAAGYAVFAPEARRDLLDPAKGWADAPEGLALAQLYTDALTAAAVAARLEHTLDLSAFGEGLGGGLALVVSALMPQEIVRCACHNPLPADLPAVVRSGASADFYAGVRTHFRFCDPCQEQLGAFLDAMSFIDLLSFAPNIACPVLMGTSMMDSVARPDTQDALFDALVCPKQRLRYAKHIHERLNHFEEALLCFLHKAYE